MSAEDAFLDEFARLPVGVRMQLMEQVKAVAGLSQPEKAHLVRQLGQAKRVIVPTVDPDTAVAFAKSDSSEGPRADYRAIPKQRADEFRRYFGHRDFLIGKVREGSLSRRSLLLAIDQMEAEGRHVEESVDAVSGLILQGFHTAAGRDTFAEIIGG
jgi:hypothetical protein